MSCPACVGVAPAASRSRRSTPSTYMFWKSSLAIGRVTPFEPWPLVVTQTSTWLPAAICPPTACGEPRATTTARWCGPSVILDA